MCNLDATKVRSFPVDNKLFFGDCYFPIYRSGKFLVFKVFLKDRAKRGKTINSGWTQLYLATSSMKILDNFDYYIDHNNASYHEKFPILCINGLNIISKGDLDRLFLHKIDKKQDKLILAKILKVSGMTIQLNLVTKIPNCGFACHCIDSSGKSKKGVILSFSSDMRLERSLALNEGNWVSKMKLLPSSDGNVVFESVSLHAKILNVRYDTYHEMRKSVFKANFTDQKLENLVSYYYDAESSGIGSDENSNYLIGIKGGKLIRFALG